MGPGIGLLAGGRELTCPDAAFGVARAAIDLARELRHADRPPRVLAEARQAFFEVGAQPPLVTLRGAVLEKQALTLEARLELGSGLMAVAVPALEIGEHRGGT